MISVALDFETFYSTATKYSLRNMTTQTYIRDPRFQAIGVGIKLDQAPTVWYPGPEIKPALADIDWSKAVLKAHNTRFDGAILNWIYGHKPAHLVCSMSMAASSGLGLLVGQSLEALAIALRGAGFDVPLKGHEVVKADGLRYEDFSPAALADYGTYCRTDVDICHAIVDILTDLTPAQELWWQSIILKAFTDPVLTLDRELLLKELVRVRALKASTLDVAAAQDGCTPLQFRAKLMSNNKFAELLVNLGVEPPTKISKATGKTTFAFAKTDEGMQELVEHDDLAVQTLVAARLGNKSTIQETRLERLIGLTEHGPLPMPYKISGAHTHRLSGDESINVQNWPSGRVTGQSKEMRRALMAPDGYMVMAADSAQVELRSGGWVVDEPYLMNVFAQKGDPYSVFGSDMYGYSADEIRAGAKADVPEFVRMRAGGKAGLLGCIYGAGPNGFMVYCKNTAKIPMDEAGAEFTVGSFRSTMPAFPRFWRICDGVLRALINGKSGYFGGPTGNLFFYDGQRKLFGLPAPGIRLPDGLWITYPNIREKYFEGEGSKIVYDMIKKGRVVGTRVIYGSKAFENLNQALAFSAMKYQLIMLDGTYRTLGNVHDEGLHLVPEQDKDVALQLAESVYATVPAWLQGCPLKGEAGINKRYGDC